MLGALNQLFSFERTEFSQKNKYGDISKKDPPVPMPNTDVKLLCAEDSEGFPLVKAGRRRSFFVFTIKYFIAPLAQLDRASDFGSEG